MVEDGDGGGLDVVGFRVVVEIEEKVVVGRVVCLEVVVVVPIDGAFVVDFDVDVAGFEVDDVVLEIEFVVEFALQFTLTGQSQAEICGLK
jgi:hypothetical protein